MKDKIRAYQHAPIGVLAGWLLFVNGFAGLALVIGFLGYEALQDFRKIDHSYKDVIGFLWALGITIAIFAIIIELL